MRRKWVIGINVPIHWAQTGIPLNGYMKPDSIIDGNDFVAFINTRGREKMLYGTEFPTIPWGRSRDEIDARGIRPEVQTAFFAENTKRVFKWDADQG